MSKTFDTVISGLRDFETSKLAELDSIYAVHHAWLASAVGDVKKHLAETAPANKKQKTGIESSINKHEDADKSASRRPRRGKTALKGLDALVEEVQVAVDDVEQENKPAIVEPSQQPVVVEEEPVRRTTRARRGKKQEKAEIPFEQIMTKDKNGNTTTVPEAPSTENVEEVVAPTPRPQRTTTRRGKAKAQEAKEEEVSVPIIADVAEERQTEAVHVEKAQEGVETLQPACADTTTKRKPARRRAPTRKRAAQAREPEQATTEEKEIAAVEEEEVVVVIEEEAGKEEEKKSVAVVEKAKPAPRTLKTTKKKATAKKAAAKKQPKKKQPSPSAEEASNECETNDVASVQGGATSAAQPGSMIVAELLVEKEQVVIVEEKETVVVMETTAMDKEPVVAAPSPSSLPLQPFVDQIKSKSASVKKVDPTTNAIPAAAALTTTTNEKKYADEPSIVPPTIQESQDMDVDDDKLPADSPSDNAEAAATVDCKAEKEEEAVAVEEDEEEAQPMIIVDANDDNNNNNAVEAAIPPPQVPTADGPVAALHAVPVAPKEKPGVMMATGENDKQEVVEEHVEQPSTLDANAGKEQEEEEEEEEFKTAPLNKSLVSNVVSSIRSFLPMSAKAASPIGSTARKAPKVKALEAAEAAKRKEEEKAAERARQKIEAERLRLERLKAKAEAEILEAKRREEAQIKKEREAAQRRKEREEAERREKEEKARRLEELKQKRREEAALGADGRHTNGTPAGGADPLAEAKERLAKIQQQVLMKQQGVFTPSSAGRATTDAPLNAATTSSVVAVPTNEKASVSIPRQNPSHTSTQDVPMTYEISPYKSDFESDDDVPKKPVPDWARGRSLVSQLMTQMYVDPDEVFQQHAKTCTLDEVFAANDKKGGNPDTFNRRSSSGNWLEDRVTWKEELSYKKAMGYL